MAFQRSTRLFLLLLISFVVITNFVYYYKEPVTNLLSSTPSLPFQLLGNNIPENASSEHTKLITPTKTKPKTPVNTVLTTAENWIGNVTKTLVVSSQKKDNTTWIDQLLPDWEYVRYVTDEPTGKFTVPKNKGNEAMVYLT